FNRPSQTLSLWFDRAILSHAYIVRSIGCLHATFHNNAHGGSSSVFYSSPVAKFAPTDRSCHWQDKCFASQWARAILPPPFQNHQRVGTFQDVHAQTVGGFMKNKLALCSRGQVGLITHDKRQPVMYADHSVGMAYLGFYL